MSEFDVKHFGNRRRKSRVQSQSRTAPFGGMYGVGVRLRPGGARLKGKSLRGGGNGARRVGFAAGSLRGAARRWNLGSSMFAKGIVIGGEVEGGEEEGGVYLTFKNLLGLAK